MAVVKSSGRLTCEIKLKVNGRVVRFPGVRDRGTSKQIELKISKLVVAQAYHQSVPPEIMDWVFDLPSRAPRLYQRLVDEGLVAGALLGRRKLNDLLLGEIEKRAGFDQAVKSCHRNGNTEEQARRKVLVKRHDLYVCKSQGMLQSMCAGGVTADHILETVTDVDAVLTGCNFVYWEDLDAERVKQWIHEQRSARADFGPTTANHYITSVKSFANWCKKQLKREHEISPLEHLKKLDPSDDIRVKRRPATEDEIAKTIAATAFAGTVKGLPAEDRAMLYRVATTLTPRAAECASLTRESFIEQDDGLTLLLDASATKNGKEAKLPVPNALAAMLRPWLNGKPEGQKLWLGKWHREAAEMLRKDLAAAGVTYETAEGVLDFHATRHTAITRGSRVMPVVDLKTFARHSKIETTMRYVHTDEQKLREQVDQLGAINALNAQSKVDPDAGDPQSEKCVRKSVRASGSTRHGASTSRIISRSAINDTTPCEDKGLAAIDIDFRQRARRGSNPQPTDRQSAEFSGQGVSEKTGNAGKTVRFCTLTKT